MKNVHFDHVGSFLRPEFLKKARIDFKSGKISAADLKKIEDEAIVDLVSKEKKAGLPYITDGEFRRDTWHLDFMWGFHGIGHEQTKTGLPFHGEAALIDDTFLTGRVSVDEHPFVAHYQFLKALEDDSCEAKQTVPAPAQFLAQFTMPFAIENTKRFYSDTEELIQDIAAGYRKVICKLYDAGCRTLQFDDCTWGMLVDSQAPKIYETDTKGLEAVAESYLRINNLALEGKPEDLTINTHVCRGNYHSTFASSGPYDFISKYLFKRENVNRFLLEFDDERSGGFKPLSDVADGKLVVLGLLTSKSPKLEDKEAIKARIREASAYIPLERLSLSTQCGFASCEIGNKLTEAEEWSKLALVREIAEEIWG